MRTRTPPELKWLLVERATIAGEIARLQEQQARISNEIAEQQARLSALDTALHLTNSAVAPNAAGELRSHRNRYSSRGQLKAFIVEVLKTAAPGSLDTRELTYRVIGQFGLSFATKKDFQAFANNSVKRQLLLLQKEGLVEALHATTGKVRVGIWRWTTAPAPSVVLAQLAAAGEESAHEVENALGREVAHQPGRDAGRRAGAD